MPIDTNGHITVIVESVLPSISADRRKLIDTAIVNAPGLLYDIPTSGGLNFKMIAIGAVVAVGAILLLKRGR